MAELLTIENLIALLTLSGLEIVLGIDNIVFIAILCGKLPANQQDKARKLGLFLAMFIRIALLLAISWVMSLTFELFDVSKLWGGSHAATHVATDAATQPHNPFSISGKDLILLTGGLFLLFKATHEIHNKLEGDEDHTAKKKTANGFTAVIVQILLIDIVFSLDSVITAVGMAKSIWVMVIAVVIAVGVMMAFSGVIVRFIDKHPTMKMLALAFLLMIGLMLVVEAFDVHVSKGYIYFAMAFSLLVESLNIFMRKKKAAPIPLDQTPHEKKEA